MIALYLPRPTSTLPAHPVLTKCNGSAGANPTSVYCGSRSTQVQDGSVQGLSQLSLPNKGNKEIAYHGRLNCDRVRGAEAQKATLSADGIIS